MVDTATVSSGNGERPPPVLPDTVTITIAEMQGFPSPGTQRALKAETGRDYMELVGPKADSADRTQTQIWTHLRRTIRDVRWEDCSEISMLLADAGAAAVDPSLFANSVLSPDFAASGE
jgi:hypothetical protein